MAAKPGLDDVPIHDDPWKRGVLVVFTDALGSTPRDEEALSAPPGHERPCLGGALKQSLEAMRQFRDELFREQLDGLGTDALAGKWQILKNVGDALVLALYPDGDDTPSLIAQSIRAVLGAWDSCRQSKHAIRVAMHYCPPGYAFLGSQLTGISAALAEMKHLNEQSRDAFLRSLQFDLFGPGMNRIARLSSAARGSIFVISEQTYLQMKGSEQLSAEEMRRLYRGGWQPENGFRLRGPVPLVRAKGVDTVALPEYVEETVPFERRPWWVWEVRGSDSGHDTPTFGAESKRVQSLRIIHGFYHTENTFEWCCNTESDLEVGLRKLLDSDEFISFSFFSDLWLKICGVLSFYQQEDERHFVRQAPTWADVFANHPTAFFPRYAVLTSCPDDPTDDHLRDKLSPTFQHSGTIRCAQSVSHGVQGFIQIRDDTDRLRVSGVTARGRRLYLLLFQVRHPYLNEAADPDQFLQGSLADLPLRKTPGRPAFAVIASGLLTGDKDGFILAADLAEDGSADVRDQEFQEIIKEQVMGRGLTFFGRIAPIRLLLCRSMRGFEQANLEWLRELWQWSRKERRQRK